MKPLHAKIIHRYEGSSILHGPITSTKELEHAVNWLEEHGTEVKFVELSV